MNKYKINNLFLNYIYLFTIAFIVILPIIWLISTSLRLPIESYNLPPKWLPTDFMWEIYYEVMFSYYLDKEGIFVGTLTPKVPFIHMLFNSFVVTISITFGQVFSLV